MVTAAFR